MDKDRVVLRELAREYADAAGHPRNVQNAKLYRAANGLHMIRPVVLIDEEPWCELGGGGELDLQCSDECLRGAELYMRKMLYKWRHHPADMIVPPYLPVYKIIGGKNGLPTVREHTLATDDANNIRAHEYEDQFADPSDIEKLQMPQLTYEESATLAVQDRWSEAVGYIIPVCITGHNAYAAPWDRIATYRGVTSLLMDLADRPGHTHAIMERMTAMYIEQYRQYESLGLFEGETPLIHCTAGLCDELGKPQGQRVLRKNVWGRGMAQIFASVSSAMHDEFEIEYMKRIMEPFGLTYYGCCEPLDRKIDIVRKLPHLRKISITPWADAQVAAEAIGGDFVVSLKPNPAHVGAFFDEDVVKKEITGLLDACRRYGCSCELVLKDISTVGGCPDHLARWEKAVMEIVKAY